MSKIHGTLQIHELYAADERTVQAAHDTYQAPEQFTVATSARAESRNGDVETRQYNPLMLQYIAKVTGGDTARLIYHADGSITIANNAQR